MTAAAEDSDAKLTRLFSGLRRHFDYAATRHPGEGFREIVQALDLFLNEPGHFEVASDGTAESTMAASEKNRAAFAAGFLLNLAPKLVTHLAQFDSAMEESVGEFIKVNRQLIEVEDFFAAIPSRRALALKEAGEELSAAAGQTEKRGIQAQPERVRPAPAARPAPVRK